MVSSSPDPPCALWTALSTAQKGAWLWPQVGSPQFRGPPSAGPPPWGCASTFAPPCFPWEGTLLLEGPVLTDVSGGGGGGVPAALCQAHSGYSPFSKRWYIGSHNGNLLRFNKAFYICYILTNFIYYSV